MTVMMIDVINRQPAERTLDDAETHTHTQMIMMMKMMTLMWRRTRTTTMRIWRIVV